MIPLTREDVPIRIEDEGVEFRTRDVGDMTLAWVRLAKGTNLAPGLAGLPDDLCPCPHWGYVVSGRLRMQEKDGESVYEAGQGLQRVAFDLRLTCRLSPLVAADIGKLVGGPVALAKDRRGLVLAAAIDASVLAPRVHGTEPPEQARVDSSRNMNRDG